MHIEGYRIELRDVHLWAHHGVMAQEREIGAWFTIDISIALGSCSGAVNDNIEGTVSYADVYEILRSEMAIPSNLLENVCKRISERLYETFEHITGIEISLCKLMKSVVPEFKSKNSIYEKYDK